MSAYLLDLLSGLAKASAKQAYGFSKRGGALTLLLLGSALSNGALCASTAPVATSDSSGTALPKALEPSLDDFLCLETDTLNIGLNAFGALAQVEAKATQPVANSLPRVLCEADYLDKDGNPLTLSRLPSTGYRTSRDQNVERFEFSGTTNENPQLIQTLVIARAPDTQSFHITRSIENRSQSPITLKPRLTLKAPTDSSVQVPKLEDLQSENKAVSTPDPWVAFTQNDFVLALKLNGHGSVERSVETPGTDVTLVGEAQALKPGDTLAYDTYVYAGTSNSLELTAELPTLARALKTPEEDLNEEAAKGVLGRILIFIRRLKRYFIRNPAVGVLILAVIVRLLIESVFLYYARNHFGKDAQDEVPEIVSIMGTIRALVSLAFWLSFQKYLLYGGSLGSITDLSSPNKVLSSITVLSTFIGWVDGQPLSALVLQAAVSWFWVAKRSASLNLLCLVLYTHIPYKAIFAGWKALVRSWQEAIERVEHQ